MTKLKAFTPQLCRSGHWPDQRRHMAKQPIPHQGDPVAESLSSDEALVSALSGSAALAAEAAMRGEPEEQTLGRLREIRNRAMDDQPRPFGGTYLDALREESRRNLKRIARKP